MQHPLVAPVWHNREVHRDFERWSLRKKTVYDPGNYVDVGGHGALIVPGSLQLQPTRKYEYRLAATGCALPVSSDRASSHVALVDFDPERRTLLVGETLSGVFRRHPDTFESERIDVDAPLSVKVQDLNSDAVTIGIASCGQITALRGSEVVARQQLAEPVDSYDLSPFIHAELVTACRSSLRLAGSTLTLKSNLIVESVSFFTHPRHLAVVQADSVTHCDTRTPDTHSKVVDSHCLHLLPKNCFCAAKVNCRNINQLFVVSSDCLSLWDIRYPTQPMGVFNHYVSRSAQLLGVQTLPTKDALLLLVRSSARSTLFEFGSTSASPNATLLGPQLQFAAPVDTARYCHDQTGDEVAQELWSRLSQPAAGCCVVPSRQADDTEFALHTFTTAGDWFTQRIVREPALSDAGNPLGQSEKTFAFGIDCLPLDGDQLQEVSKQLKQMRVDALSTTAKHSPPESDSVSLTIGSPKLFLEGASRFDADCPVCSDGAAVTEMRDNHCNNCQLGAAAGMLNDAWLKGGLIRETHDLTEEEDALANELLGQNAGGLSVSDAVRAVWGEVDWRVTGEAGTGAGGSGHADDPADDGEENADDAYDGGYDGD